MHRQKMFESFMSFNIQINKVMMLSTFFKSFLNIEFYINLMYMYSST